jgi:hypothetical protein
MSVEGSVSSRAKGIAGKSLPVIFTARGQLGDDLGLVKTEYPVKAPPLLVHPKSRESYRHRNSWMAFFHSKDTLKENYAKPSTPSVPANR